MTVPASIHNHDILRLCRECSSSRGVYFEYSRAQHFAIFGLKTMKILLLKPPHRKLHFLGFCALIDVSLF